MKYVVIFTQFKNEYFNINFLTQKKKNVWLFDLFRCGPGNTANDYEDLGNDEEVDKCCRDHDHCDNMASGEEKYGLKNDDFFTRLHCQCDKEFKSCLQKVIIASSIFFFSSSSSRLEI